VRASLGPQCALKLLLLLQVQRGLRVQEGRQQHLLLLLLLVLLLPGLQAQHWHSCCWCCCSPAGVPAVPEQGLLLLQHAEQHWCQQGALQLSWGPVMV
jgi:hypothetical protein